MPGIIWDQLDELRRQIEEDYRTDMAAIEHLLRRFSGAPAAASAPAYTPVSNGGAHQGPSRLKSAPPPQPDPASDAPERESDDADGSLRAMFAKNPPKAKGAS